MERNPYSPTVQRAKAADRNNRLDGGHRRDVRTSAVMKPPVVVTEWKPAPLTQRHRKDKSFAANLGEGIGLALILLPAYVLCTLLAGR